MLVLVAYFPPTDPTQLLKLTYIACAATLLTHPLAWASNQILMSHLPFPQRATLIESAVVVLEGTLYAQLAHLGWGRGMLLSTVANATSFFSGLAIYSLL